MRITLIRHGEPEWVKNGLNVDNPPLTVKGQEQAEMVATFLADTRFDEIYVSPLLRAQQTAAPSRGSPPRRQRSPPESEAVNP
jgi:probable phosphoglycerate mutase